MASEQMNLRKDNTTGVRDEVEKDRVPKMTSHFEHLAEQAKGSPDKKSHPFDSLSQEKKESERGDDFEAADDRKSFDQRTVGKFEVRLGEEEDKDESGKEEEQGEQPTLEEIAKLRAIAQQKSTEAIKAAEERYTRALQAADKSSEKGSESKETCLQRGQFFKEKTLEGGSAAKEAMEKVKDYTVEKAAEAKEATAEVAVGVKEKAVAVGWTAAHYSTEKTVEGTTAVARAVKGAVEYAGSKAAELAAKPLTVAKDVAVSAGESAKEYTARKKVEAQRELEAKKRSTEQQGTETSTTTINQNKFDYGRNSMTTKDEEERQRKGSSGGGGATVLGAIGETIVEIAQNTKDLVIGGEDQTT